MKRFYKQAKAVKADDSSYCIELDGKSVKTQNAGSLLTCSCETLAHFIAKEWQDQGDIIDPQTMPLTQIISTSLDTETSQREEITKAALGYVNTDLLCYRTDMPPELQKRQEEKWDPVLQWFEKQYGHKFETTFALVALTQADDIHKIFADEVANLDALRFTVFQIATSVTGSVILALAFVKGAVQVDDIYQAVNVEELYRAEIYDEKKYGVDPMQERQRESLLRDLNAMHLILHSAQK